VATEYSRRQRAEIAAALAAASRQWRRVGDNFDAGWSLIGTTLTAISNRAQTNVARGAAAFIPAVLEETGQSAATSERIDTRPLIGAAGDGRPLESLLYGSVTTAKTAIADGSTVAQALTAGGQFLTLSLGTALSDTGRHAESLAMGVRPVSGYVRMLTPPSCSRCVILAGQWYRKSQGFARHPGCDCRHIPASESVAGDMTVSPLDYFDSLSPDEQARTFTAAGAEAIRNGADIHQVVNARRGVSVAQVGGRKSLVTTSGTSKRGLYGSRVRGKARLMPETIARIATSKEDYLRLLRANAYIF